jgi:hypothetical protein
MIVQEHMDQINLSNSHNPDWALFLPAVSSFFISGLGKQREGEQYFDQARIPQAFNGDVECLNFLNSNQGLYNYKWGLYSAGHANLDLSKDDPSESIIRKREPGTFMLGDSGGFQIMKGQWEGDWKDPSCPKSMKKRELVLKWMDSLMDYGMCLDVPSQTLRNKHLLDKHGISTIEQAVQATHINNEYFIKNRTGECKFLNVLQGLNHTQSDDWYDEMKKYCDPAVYPDNHFNGWAFGGQNKIDIHLMLRRLIIIIHDGLLEQGKHDLLHCLGTSILEYAVLFTDIQRAIRRYHNPDFKITFDCASPFFSAAKGLAYHNTSIKHAKKWTYSMEKTAENKNYATDSRTFLNAVIQDNVHKSFTPSPITDKMLIKDLCYRGQGFLGQHGKETKTSWDTLSYTLIQAHNVYQHISAVQEANRRYEQGVIPKMLMNKFEAKHFGDIVNEIFSKQDLTLSLSELDKHSKFWMQMQSGSQGFSGKKTLNNMTGLHKNFEGELDHKVEKDPKPESAKNMLEKLGIFGIQNEQQN